MEEWDGKGVYNFMSTIQSEDIVRDAKSSSMLTIQSGMSNIITMFALEMK